MKVHTYNNGVKMFEPYVLRKENIINYHEPVQELIMEQIFRNTECGVFVDVGASYGYYLFMADRFGLFSYGYEMQDKRTEGFRKNLSLNSPGNIAMQGEFKHDQFKQHDNEETIIMMDIQGAEVGILKKGMPENFPTIVIATHKTKDGTTNKTVIDILKSCKYKIKCSFEPGEVNFQPDGIVWAEK